MPKGYTHEGLQDAVSAEVRQLVHCPVWIIQNSPDVPCFLCAATPSTVTVVAVDMPSPAAPADIILLSQHKRAV